MAIRSQSEHTFATSIAQSTTFWTAAQSHVYNSVTLWLWVDYGIAVDFTAPWVTVQSLNYAVQVDKVLLDGHPGAYAWTYANPNTTMSPFICRKQGLHRDCMHVSYMSVCVDQ